MTTHQETHHDTVPAATDPATPASGRVTVIGTGYLGATHAACLAELGYDVLGLDTDPAKVADLAAGRLPFYEPGLAELVERHTASGRLAFTTDPREAAEFADLHFVCVGTPQRRDSMAADTSHVTAAVSGLVPHLRRDALLVGKSTVPVGTAAALALHARSVAPDGVEVAVAWNPEFLREGRAVEDTLRPDRIVVGVTDPLHEKVLRELYAPVVDVGVPFVVTDLATSELVKVAANAFLATKISFANAIAELCDAAGADVVALTDAIGRDARIGHQFLSAGLGFGGGCLPKDIRALMARAGELGVDEALTFLREVDAINMRRRSRTVALAVEECGGSVLGRRVAVLGAAFKPGTDDVRDSPALNVAAQLQLQGAHVRVHDPRATATAARTFPTLGYADTVEDAVTGSDLVLHLTEWDEYRALDPAALQPARRVVIDGRNALDAERWAAAGWRVCGLGRPAVGAGVGPAAVSR